MSSGAGMAKDLFISLVEKNWYLVVFKLILKLQNILKWTHSLSVFYKQGLTKERVEFSQFGCKTAIAVLFYQTFSFS